MQFKHKALSALALIAALGATQAQADTVAYWRFENGSAGAAVTSIPDVTGHNNTLAPPTTGNPTPPLYSTDLPGNPNHPPATNALSLDYSGVNFGDINTGGATGDLNTHTFNQWTIEASIKFVTFGGFQTFICKEGHGIPNSDTADLASLYFQSPDPGSVGGVNLVSIRASEADGRFIALNGTTPLVAGTWYNVAATSDGKTLRLYVQLPNGVYNLEGSRAFTGAMYNQNRNWAVGRGYYANNAGDRFNGLLDEVRISDSALTPDQFLFSPPTTGVPAAPINLTGMAFDSGARLAWNQVAGAATYNVLRATKSGGPYATVATGLIDATYTDTGLSDGTTYYYVVTATNTVGNSANSNQIALTPTVANTGTGHFSINFSSNDGGPATTPMDPTEIAGVDQVANWNNSATLAPGHHGHYNDTGAPVPLVDSAGAPISATVDWQGSGNGWASGIADTPGDFRMMKGYLDTSNTGTHTITVSGISPTKSYLVYVYDAPAETGRVGGYTIGSQTVYISSTSIFNGTYVRSTSTDPLNPGAGNYAVFTVSGQNSFTLSCTPDIAVNGTRAVVNGIQILALAVPAPPTNLAAVALDRSVGLSWNTVSSAVSYNVLRGTMHSGPYTQVATGVTGGNYTDTGLTNGTTYYYVVQSVNNVGVSPNSNEAFATPLAASIGNGDGLLGTYYPGDAADFSPENGTPFFTHIDPVINFSVDNGTQPYAPTAFPTGVPHDHFTTVWTGKFLAPYTGSYIFRAITDDGGRLTVNGVTNATPNYQGPTPTDLTAQSLTAGQKYDVKIEYFQGGGGATAQFVYSYNSLPFVLAPQSQLFSTLTGAPLVPGGLTAVASLNVNILNWNGSAGAVTYNVKRSLTSGGPYTTIATGVNALIYKDTTVTGGTTYYYVVSASNASGESGNSNEAFAKAIGTYKPVAYWRFEEGPVNTHTATSPATLADASGNGNLLTTFLDDAAPTYRASTPGVPNGVTINNFSVDFSEAPGPNYPLRELTTFATPAEDIDTHVFGTFTVETSVYFNDLNNYQTFLGKDGFQFPGDGIAGNASLYFQKPDPGNTNGVSVFSFRTHQANGTFVIVNGTTPLVTGKWYNVAAVADGSTLSLYLQSTPGGPYNLENSLPFIGGMVIQPRSWSVGRGMYGNNATDQFRGLEDEIRISDIALTPAQFLFAAPSGATVTGNIALEGVNDLSATSAAAPLGTFDIQFRTPGTLTVIKEFPAVKLTVATGSANGKFSVSGLTAGTYDVWIKGAKNLAVLNPNVVVTATSGVVPDSLLGAGDSDNNNTVDVLDFGNLVNSYGSKASDPNSGYDPTVDFDFNGAVDVLDFGDLVNEYGVSGPK